MIKKILIVLAISFSLFSYEIKEELHSHAFKVNDLLIDCKFDEADSYADSLINSNESEPLFYYLKLTSMGLRMVDYDEIYKRDEFLKLFTRGYALLNRLEKTSGATSDLVMLQGFLKAAKSSLHLLDGSYMTAVSDGKESLKLIKKSKELNTQNFDVDYYVGFYNYAQSELKKRLFFILFWMEGSSSEGVLALERCSEKSRFMGRAADMVLVDILVREKKFDKVYEMLNPLLESYPQSRFLLWTKMRYYELQKDYSKTARAYKNLAENYFADGVWHNGLITAELARKYLKKSGEDSYGFISFVKKSIDQDELSAEDLKRYKSVIKD
jgi:tetratricopeptide (TPR) repeat protein